MTDRLSLYTPVVEKAKEIAKRFHEDPTTIDVEVKTMLYDIDGLYVELLQYDAEAKTRSDVLIEMVCHLKAELIMAKSSNDPVNAFLRHRRETALVKEFKGGIVAEVEKEVSRREQERIDRECQAYQSGPNAAEATAKVTEVRTQLEHMRLDQDT
jgi:hypothetical protein